MQQLCRLSRVTLLTASLFTVLGCGAQAPEDELSDEDVGTADSALGIGRSIPGGGGMGISVPTGPTFPKCDAEFSKCLEACALWAGFFGEAFEKQCIHGCEDAQVDCKYGPSGPVDPIWPD